MPNYKTDDTAYNIPIWLQNWKDTTIHIQNYTIANILQRDFSFTV